MATIVHTCGAECAALLDHWTSVTGTSPTRNTSIFRKGPTSIRVNPAASTSGVNKTYTSTATVVFHGYLYLATLPGANQQWLAKFGQSASGDLAMGFKTGTNFLYIFVDASDTTGQTSNVALTAATWNKVDIRINAVSNPWVVDWAVNGVAQATYSPAAATAAFTATRIGAAIASTYDAYWDDLAWSHTLADYPISDGVVGQVLPETYTAAPGVRRHGIVQLLPH